MIFDHNTIYQFPCQFQPVSGEQFEWSEELQGFVLGSFYIGYVLSHLPGAWLCERIGPMYVAIASQSATVIVTLVTPVIASWVGAPGLIVVRAIMGLFQGGFFPAVSNTLAVWIPQNQRAVVAALVYNGVPVSLNHSNISSAIVKHSSLCLVRRHCQ